MSTINTHPDQPHDSQAETLATHYREEAEQSMAAVDYDASDLAYRLRLLADDETYCRDAWSASVCRQASDMLDIRTAPSPAAKLVEAIRSALTPNKQYITQQRHELCE